jgi:diadenosine tetraphosphate (Ap4A) HIT family hydrolase
VSDDCHVCTLLGSVEPEQVVLDEGPWTATLMANVPGWIQLATKEHVEGPWSLDEDEAATLGSALSRVASALKSETGADRIHVVYLGENALHFHLGLFPRRPGEEALLENGRIAEEVTATADQAKAQALGAALRNVL